VTCQVRHRQSPRASNGKSATAARSGEAASTRILTVTATRDEQRRRPVLGESTRRSAAARAYPRGRRQGRLDGDPAPARSTRTRSTPTGPALKATRPRAPRADPGGSRRGQGGGPSERTSAPRWQHERVPWRAIASLLITAARLAVDRDRVVRSPRSLMTAGQVVYMATGWWCSQITVIPGPQRRERALLAGSDSQFNSVTAGRRTATATLDTARSSCRGPAARRPVGCSAPRQARKRRRPQRQDHKHFRTTRVTSRWGPSGSLEQITARDVYKFKYDVDTRRRPERRSRAGMGHRHRQDRGWLSTPTATWRATRPPDPSDAPANRGRRNEVA